MRKKNVYDGQCAGGHAWKPFLACVAGMDLLTHWWLWLRCEADAPPLAGRRPERSRPPRTHASSLIKRTLAEVPSASDRDCVGVRPATAVGFGRPSVSAARRRAVGHSQGRGTLRLSTPTGPRVGRRGALRGRLGAGPGNARGGAAGPRPPPALLRARPVQRVVGDRPLGVGTHPVPDDDRGPAAAARLCGGALLRRAGTGDRCLGPRPPGRHRGRYPADDAQEGGGRAPA